MSGGMQKVRIGHLGSCCGFGQTDFSEIVRHSNLLIAEANNLHVRECEPQGIPLLREFLLVTFPKHFIIPETVTLA